MSVHARHYDASEALAFTRIECFSPHNTLFHKSTMLSASDTVQQQVEHREDARLIWIYEKRQLKLGKRLAYILRYGAEKENCRVDDGKTQVDSPSSADRLFLVGWILIDELLRVPLLSEYTVEEVLGDIQTSYSYRKTPRYQWETRVNGVYVRAAYGRKFERVNQRT